MARTPSIVPSDDGPDDREGFEVQAPFDRGWLETLKALVPSRDRRWFDERKAWWIAAEHVDVVEHFTLECFGSVDLVDEDGVVDTRYRSGERVRQENLL